MDRSKLLGQLDELQAVERASKITRYDADGNPTGEQEITSTQYTERYVPPDPYAIDFDPSEVDERRKQHAEALAAQAKPNQQNQNGNLETAQSQFEQQGQPNDQGDQDSQQNLGNGNGGEQSPMTKSTLEELQRQLDEAKAECAEGLKEDPNSTELQESQQQLDKLQEKLDAHKQALNEQQQQQQNVNSNQSSDQQDSQQQDNGQSEEQSKQADQTDQKDQESQQDENSTDTAEHGEDQSDSEEQKRPDEQGKEKAKEQQMTDSPQQQQEEPIPPDQDYYKPVWYDNLKNLVTMGFDVLVCGPAGCGKSRAGREIGRELGKPGNTHAFRAGMRKSELLYSKELRNGDSVIELSPLLREVQKPLVTVIDEALSVDPEVLICFNGLLESSQRSVDTPIGEVVRDKEHRFILTSNTDGRSESRIYRAPQMQDASILSRVMVMNVDYDEKVEKNIAYASNAPDWQYIVHNTHALRTAVRKADMVMDISTRWIVQACKLNKAGVARNKALAMAMLDRFTENELKKLQSMSTTIDFSGASKLRK